MRKLPYDPDITLLCLAIRNRWTQPISAMMCSGLGFQGHYHLECHTVVFSTHYTCYPNWTPPIRQEELREFNEMNR